jgi:hypothetical protein
MNSNWNQVQNGGKGSGRRSGANDKLYKENYEKIFGNKKNKEEEIDNDKKSDNTREESES